MLMMPYKQFTDTLSIANSTIAMRNNTCVAATKCLMACFLLKIFDKPAGYLELSLAIFTLQ